MIGRLHVDSAAPGDRVYIDSPSHVESLGVDETLARNLLGVIQTRPGLTTKAIDKAVIGAQPSSATS